MLFLYIFIYSFFFQKSSWKQLEAKRLSKIIVNYNNPCFGMFIEQARGALNFSLNFLLG